MKMVNEGLWGRGQGEWPSAPRELSGLRRGRSGKAGSEAMEAAGRRARSDVATHPYARAAYAAAQSGVENLRPAPGLGEHLVRRAVTDEVFDLAGVYPMSPMGEARAVEEGLERLRQGGAVSLVMVPDPLFSPDPSRLQAIFDHFRPFKPHYLVDPGVTGFAPTRHHRERIRRGLRRCMVDEVRLCDWMDLWEQLYRDLQARRGFAGPAAFSAAYVSMLAVQPEIRAFLARTPDGEGLGMTLWFAHGGVAYNHLTAVSLRGYAAGASYALYDAAISAFSDCVINLGGGAGAGDGAGGLAEFKRGFANSEVQAWIAGAVLDRSAYDRLVREGSGEGAAAPAFFPAYRAGRG